MSDEIEKRVERLEYQVRQLRQLVDPSRAPFANFILENDLRESHVKALNGLLLEAQESLSTDKPMSWHDFEGRIRKILPGCDEYNFVKGLLWSVKAEDRFEDVYEHMKNDGLNVP